MINCKSFELRFCLFIPQMAESQIVLLLLLALLSIFPYSVSLPMPCNAYFNDSCPASLYYVPKHPKSTNETAALFDVASSAVSKTADGFLITVSCGCLADHKELLWHVGYTVESGDTWKLLKEKFGLLVMEIPEKYLIPTLNISVDILCGCFEGENLVTYAIRPGDTLYTICSRFGADVDRLVEINKVPNPSLIQPGDVIFIPSKGVGHIVVPDENGSKGKGVSKSQILIVLAIVIAAITVMLILVAVLLWIYCKRKGQQQFKVSHRGIKSSQWSPSSFFGACESSSVLNSDSSSKESKGCTSFKSVKTTAFSYSEVCDATYNFSGAQKIGQGSYGCVYSGRLKGMVVAIKQMKNTKSKEFFAELNILCKVHHNNLIELIGYSAGMDSLFLVYEFAENGALSDHLHNPAAKGHKPLSWGLRVRIALDAAKGLEYIHMQIKPFYVHRDVKTSNILLDSNFCAKIADFGLVKLLEHSPDVGAVTSRIVGTVGYLAPEYVRDGYLTPKSDVYAYGVVLMELITGQPALSTGQNVGNAPNLEYRSVVKFVLSALEDKCDAMTKMAERVDPNLVNYHKDSLLQIALLSKECIDDDWKLRPDMSQVVFRLSRIAHSMQ